MVTGSLVGPENFPISSFRQLVDGVVIQPVVLRVVALHFEQCLLQLLVLLECYQVLLEILLVSFATWLGLFAIELVVEVFNLFVVRFLSQVDCIGVLILSKFAHLSGSFLVLTQIRVVSFFGLGSVDL